MKRFYRLLQYFSPKMYYGIKEYFLLIAIPELTQINNIDYEQKKFY